MQALPRQPLAHVHTHPTLSESYLQVPPLMQGFPTVHVRTKIRIQYSNILRLLKKF